MRRRTQTRLATLQLALRETAAKYKEFDAALNNEVNDYVVGVAFGPIQGAECAAYKAKLPQALPPSELAPENELAVAMPRGGYLFMELQAASENAAMRIALSFHEQIVENAKIVGLRRLNIEVMHKEDLRVFDL